MEFDLSIRQKLDWQAELNPGTIQPIGCYLQWLLSVTDSFLFTCSNGMQCATGSPFQASRGEERKSTPFGWIHINWTFAVSWTPPFTWELVDGEGWIVKRKGIRKSLTLVLSLVTSFSLLFSVVKGYSGCVFWGLIGVSIAFIVSKELITDNSKCSAYARTVHYMARQELIILLNLLCCYKMQEITDRTRC